MPITGVCHDFAFTRCFPVESRLKTPSVLEHKDLWRVLRTKMKNVSPDEIDTLEPGVLTVTNSTGYPTFCPHSYYVGRDHILYSTNDPFFVKLPTAQIGVSEEHGVQAVSYNAKLLKDVLRNIKKGGKESTAQIGDDNRQLSFYWCSSAVARLGWWASK